MRKSPPSMTTKPEEQWAILIAWSTLSTTYPPFQSALSFTLLTLLLSTPLLLFFFYPSPSFLTSSLSLWLLGLYSIQRLLWNQLTNSSPDKLAISRGQREEEKRGWSSIEPIAVLLNARSEEEEEKTRWGRERGRVCLNVCSSACPWGVYNFG